MGLVYVEAQIPALLEDELDMLEGPIADELPLALLEEPRLEESPFEELVGVTPLDPCPDFALLVDVDGLAPPAPPVVPPGGEPQPPGRRQSPRAPKRAGTVRGERRLWTEAFVCAPKAQTERLAMVAINPELCCILGSSDRGCRARISPDVFEQCPPATRSVAFALDFLTLTEGAAGARLP